MANGFYLLSLCCLLWLHNLNAQTIPEFNMSNTTTQECKGILKDSEALVGGNTYGHNENFTFVIATGGKITMSFMGAFRTEAGIDTLRFFDGPDTLSPQIGPAYSGTTAPPTIISNSGFLTINFKSDGSVAYAGWQALWNSEHVEPLPPTLTVYPLPLCNAGNIKLLFDKKVACASVGPSNFTIGGPIAVYVTAVTSAQCVNVGDSTTVLNLALNRILDENCDYTVTMDLGIADNCDSIWNFTLSDTFLLNTCPFNVDIISTYDTVCGGTCTQVEAIVTGNPGNCLTFSYNWNHGLPNTAGPHSVCPTSTTTYNVGVQLSGGGPVVSASKTIYYVTPTITTTDSMEVCQSDSAFTISKIPAGGYFSGQGIIDPVAGVFDPNTAGGGSHTIYYHLTSECRDSIEIIVKAVYVGMDQAACPGTSPFLVNGFGPAGGTWSGDSISPLGIFNPALPGVYPVTYTINGCSASKLINVDSIILLTPIDTLCESDPVFDIDITPAGGVWVGPGITDSIAGLFDPAAAGFGNKTIIYKLSGCDFTVNIFVKEIDARSNQVICPTQPSFLLNPPARPANGTWSGLGILNSSAGLYDPSLPFGGVNGNDTLTYTAANGCTDNRIIYLRKTEIGKDSMFFCSDDTSIILDYNTVQRTPGGGVWMGKGVSMLSGNYYFSPSTAGVGVHPLSYSRNNCSDLIIMVVHPTAINFPDTLVCATHPDLQLGNMPGGGKWKGPGVNPVSGVFRPVLANYGVNYITYQSPSNCVKDTVAITVYPFQAAQITGIDSVVCYRDSSLQLKLLPLNGRLSGPGTNDSDYTFNAAQAGEGLHTISYSFGTGFCETYAEFKVRVLPPLVTSVTVSDFEVCLGESSTISVFPNGGLPNARYTYQWNENLFPQSSNPVVPTSTTTYVIKTSDGCSDAVIDSVTIKVAESFGLSIKTGSKKCLGESNYAVATVNGGSTYSFIWEGKKRSTTDSIDGGAGDIYQLTITDDSTGCIKDTVIKLPGFKNINAKFLVNPNFDCIPSDQKTVTLIDLSSNAVSGLWDFGTGDSLLYTAGINPTYEYGEAGYYTISLRVENEGGCEDVFSETICVRDIRPVFVADAFTPNGDGVNDVLHIKGKGFKEIYFAIYNKLGQLVFETDNSETGWNGNYRGKEAESGVYIYVVKAKLINNESITRKGNVTLIR